MTNRGPRLRKAEEGFGVRRCGGGEVVEAEDYARVGLEDVDFEPVGTIALVALGGPSIWALEVNAISPGAWLGAVYSGVFALAVAYLIWNHGLEHIGGPRTAAFSNLVPVVALVTASLWLGEDTSPTQVVGAIIIIAGVWVARMAGGTEPEPSY